MNLTRLAGNVVVLWGWRRLAVAALAGAASSLATAPVYLVPVLWLTFPVLVLLLDGLPAERDAPRSRAWVPSFAVGWAFGFGYFLGGLWWIGVAFFTVGGPVVVAAPFAVAALAGALAVFWGWATAFARLLWSDGAVRILVLAGAFALAEWARAWVLGGFPWATLGYAAAPTPLLMQSAALVGPVGLTFAAVVVFAAPVAVVASSPGRARFLVPLAALAMATAHVGYGAVRLQLAPPPGDGPLVRIVQPAFAQRDRWGAERTGDVVGRLLALSSADGAFTREAGPKVLVWPEATIPLFLAESGPALAGIADLLPPEAILLAGSVRAESDEDGIRQSFNAILAIDHRGEVRDVYDKVHLVPFGEYLPGRVLLERLGVRQFIAVPGGFSPGERRHNLQLPGLPAAAPTICYEIAFPGRVADRRDRAAWMVNVTNDDWFGASPGPLQHLHQARLRAVEEGLPLVRAANAGVSAIVDPYGRTVAAMDLGQSGFVDAPLPDAIGPTFYAGVGDGPALAVVVLVVIGVAASRFARPQA